MGTKPAAHARGWRGWSQEDVATLKKGMQVHGHQWAKIQVSFVTARCMAACGAGLVVKVLKVHGRQWANIQVGCLPGKVHGCLWDLPAAGLA